MDVENIGNYFISALEEKNGEKVIHFKEYTIDDVFVREGYEQYIEPEPEPETEPTVDDYAEMAYVNSEYTIAILETMSE